MSRNTDSSKREALSPLTRLVSDEPHRLANDSVSDEPTVESERCQRVKRLLLGETARESRERNA